MIKIGECVKIPDGRVGRVREKIGNKYKIRVMRKTSKTHQFLYLESKELKAVPCPRGWMSREGYNSYIKKTLSKMKKRKVR